MAEQLTSASGWSSCQLMDHVEEVRRRQTEVMRLLPWLIADPLLVEALELMSSAMTELIEHHDVVTYRRLAELVGEYTRKGSLVLVQGHLHTDRWAAQDGTQCQRLVVIGESVQFLSWAPELEEES